MEVTCVYSLQSMETVWGSHSDYPDYLISNDGRVRKLSNLRGELKLNGGILKPTLNEDGYLQVNINGTTERVHRLVAQVFLSNPENLPWVDHIDNNRVNNSVDNLRWVTKQENSSNRKVSTKNTTGHNGINLTRYGTYRAFAYYNGRHLEKTEKTLEEAIRTRETLLESLRNGHPGRAKKPRKMHSNDRRPEGNWQMIKGFPDYDISSDGRIWSRLSGIVVTPIRRRQGFTVGLLNSDGVLTGTQSIHQLVADAFLPRPDISDATLVDHINRNPYDNRVENLRWCTHQQNMGNKSLDKRNKSGTPGVRQNGKWWQATFTYKRQRIVVGLRFESYDAAVSAIQEKRREVLGEFAAIQ